MPAPPMARRKTLPSAVTPRPFPNTNPKPPRNGRSPSRPARTATKHSRTFTTIGLRATTLPRRPSSRNTASSRHVGARVKSMTAETYHPHQSGLPAVRSSHLAVLPHVDPRTSLIYENPQSPSVVLPTIVTSRNRRRIPPIYGLKILSRRWRNCSYDWTSRLANITATLGSFYWLGFETTGLSPDKKRLA